MVDGVAIIEVNNKDNFRLNELNWLDFRLEDVCLEDIEGVEQLVHDLPNDIKDALVLVTFKYTHKVYPSYEGDYDVDEFLTVVSHQVLIENYKEYNRNLNTILYNMYLDNSTSSPFLFVDDKTSGDCLNELLAEWAEFYNEPFTPCTNKVV